MWASVQGKFFEILARFDKIVTDEPRLFAFYLTLLLVCAALAVVAAWRGRSRQAYWWAVAAIVADIVFSWGDDTYTHVFRIAALADEIRQGAVSQVLVSTTTGEGLPVFVYYSILPYLLPVALDLLGMSAMVAFKIVAAAQFLVMAVGLQALIEVGSPRDAMRRRPDTDYLVALLFITANYVYTLWCTRASLAEFWVYSLVPWVVRWLIVPGGFRALVGLLFLQIATHPIVLSHSLVAELLVAYGLGRMPLWQAVHRLVTPLVVALVLASPYWVPQFFWQDLILGLDGLPVRFADTFLTAADLADPRYVRNIGIAMPLAMVLMIAASGAMLDGRVWFLVLATVALLAIQTVYLRPVAIHLPLLSLSLFVWRLLLPAAFLAFGTLLAGWRDAPDSAGRGLVPLATFSMLAMVWVMTSVSPTYLAVLAASKADNAARAQHDSFDVIWGVREFLPRLQNLPMTCPAEGEVAKASYQALRVGVKADSRFLAVRHGPIGIVDYQVDGVPQQPTACKDDLILGPLKAGSVVHVSEDKLDWLLMVRVAVLVAALLFVWLTPSARVRVR